METIRNHPITRFFSSYMLGVVVLAWMMVLLVIGTLYQEHWGIYRAKQLFFGTWIFLYPIEEFIRSLPAGVEQSLAGVSAMGFKIPLPGNALLTLLLFVNLLFATLFKMRYRHKILGVYDITKSAMMHMTKQLAAEMAPQVRVNCLAPGLVKTDFARVLWEDGRGEQVAKHYPLHRLGEPEDVAGATLFLAAETGRWITGQTWVLDGGGLIKFSGVG